MEQMNISFSGSDNRLLFTAVLQQFFEGQQPDSIKADYNEINFTISIPDNVFPGFNSNLNMHWKGRGSLSLLKNKTVVLNKERLDPDPAGFLNWLSKLPFEIASFETIINEWYYPDTTYEAPSFGDGHTPLGWACAFKGDGFKRLVSDRWLNYGPWKQHYGSNGTQLIQFHQLGIDATTATQQAKTGHQLMGITDDGGFIQSNYVYKYSNEGIYEPREKLVKVIVHGKDLPNRQLLDAAAAKHFHVLVNGMPVENLAYVFMDETKAREHLHAIWLHGLDCRAIIAGKETSLTDTYQPVIIKPAWTENS